jgi:hypothetical protein
MDTRHPRPSLLIIPFEPHPKLFKPRVRVVDIPLDPVLGYDGRNHRVAFRAEIMQEGRFRVGVRKGGEIGPGLGCGDGDGDWHGAGVVNAGGADEEGVQG